MGNIEVVSSLKLYHKFSSECFRLDMIGNKLAASTEQGVYILKKSGGLWENAIKRKDMPEWLMNALARIAAEQKTFICDTEEKAKAYGVPIGTTVIEKAILQVTTDSQEKLDDYRAREYIRIGLFLTN